MVDSLEALIPLVQQAVDPWEVLVQEVTADGQLYLYLNRPETLALSGEAFAAMLAVLQSTLTTHAPALSTVEVYSRILGQEEMDYQQTLRLNPDPTGGEPLPETVLAEPSLNRIPEDPTPTKTDAPAPIDNLAGFCFVRNRMLLDDESDRPNAQITESLQAFHALPLTEQLVILNLLAAWFAEPDLPAERFETLPEAGQALVQALQHDKGFLRSMKTWLSRYCANPEATMARIQPPPPSPAAPPSEPSTVVRRASTSRRSSPPEITVDISGLSAFRTQELPLILGTSAIVGGLSLLTNYLYALVGGWAMVIVATAIGSGMATLLQQPVYGAICFVVLLFAYGFAGFKAILVVPLAGIGSIVGGILIIAMKMAAPKGGNVFSPQSLRLLMAVGCVLLVINGQGLVQYGFSGGKLPKATVSRKNALKDHVATGSVTFGDRTFELQSALAIWNGRQELIVHAWTVPLGPEARDAWVSLSLGSEPSQPFAIRNLEDDEGNFVHIALNLNIPDPTKPPIRGYLGASWLDGFLGSKEAGFESSLKDLTGLTAFEFTAPEQMAGGRLKLSFDLPKQNDFALTLKVDSVVYPGK